MKRQIKTCLIVFFAIMFTSCLTMFAACIDDSDDVSSNQPQATLKFVLNDDKASYSCVGFSENESYDKADNTIVVIPNAYEGLPVTSIGKNAFLGCTGLTSMVIGDGVTFIGESAFSGCVDLTKVYYCGSAEEWNNITINSDNTYLTGATRYYYSKNQPSDRVYYWHFDENGYIVEWHKHYYTPVVTAPSCIEQGYTTYICGCGDSYVNDYVEATGEHDYTSVVIEPTCVDNGYNHYLCKVCGATKDEVIDAIGHDISENKIVVEPTCVDSGYTSGYCANCGNDVLVEYPALGHIEGDICYSNEYCGEQRLGYIPCERCNIVIYNFGHSYIKTTKEATCKEDGAYIYTCNNCGETYSEVIKAYQHIADDWTIKTAASCSCEGVAVQLCLLCNEEVNTKNIEKLAHVYNSTTSSEGITYNCIL